MPWMSINDWKRKHGIGKVKPQKKAKEPRANGKPMRQIFKLVGYDTFSNEWYDLEKFSTEKKARDAGIKRIEELSISQPARSSGGQSGIQDQVYIEYADGKRLRVLG